MATLREQIISANTGSDAEVIINLAAGTYELYELSGTGDDDTAVLGDLDIVAGKTIKIIGSGQDQTIIDGTSLGDRIFHVLPESVLEVSGVTIQGGDNLNTDLYFDELGGGFLVEGKLVLNDSILKNNQADNGGGVFVNGGIAEINNTTISGNFTGYDSAGIAVILGGQLTLNNSTLTNNTANRNAGGIGIVEFGSVTVTDSFITNNTALGIVSVEPNGIGGGIHLSDGQLTLVNTTFTGNKAGDSGGAIAFGGGTGLYTASLSGVTITQNAADSDRNGEGDGGGIIIGIVPEDQGSVSIEETQIQNNLDDSRYANIGQVIPNVLGSFTDLGENQMTTNPGLNFIKSFPFSTADGIGFDSLTGNLWLAQNVPGGIGNLVEVDTNGNVIKTVPQTNITAIQGLLGIDVLPSGNLLVSSPRSTTVVELDQNGQLIAAGGNGLGANGASLQFTVPFIGLQRATSGVVYDEVNQVIFATDTFDQKIREYGTVGTDLGVEHYAIDVPTLIQSYLGLSTPPDLSLQAIEIDPVTQNLLVVSDFDGDKILYELTRSGQVVAGTNLVELSGYDSKYSDAEGLAIDPATRTLYVAFDDDRLGQVGISSIGDQVAVYQINDHATYPSFSFAEKSVNGTVVGDAPLDIKVIGNAAAGYQIISGNPDVDKDGQSAFSISQTNQLVVNDSDDLVIGTSSTINLRVKAISNTLATDASFVTGTIKVSLLPEVQGLTLTQLGNSFTFDDPSTGLPDSFINDDRGLQGDGIAFDPITKTLFVAHTDDLDGSGPLAPSRGILQFGSKTSTQAFGTFISETDLSSLLTNAVGITSLPNGNLLVTSATTNATLTTELVELKSNGTVETNGFLKSLDASNTTGKLTLPPQYYTNVGTTASNNQPGAGRPVAVELSHLNTLLVAMSQSHTVVEFSLTEKNTDGTAKVLSTLNLSNFGLTRLAGMTVDPKTGNLLISDDFGGGTNKIYEVTPARAALVPTGVPTPTLNTLVAVIDPKTQFGIDDPEGLAFDADTDTLYVVFDGDDAGSTGNQVAAFSVNRTPVLNRIDKFGNIAGQTLTFSSEDFTRVYFDGDGTALSSITVVTLPTEGTLTMGTTAVTQGQVITAAQLSTLSYQSNTTFSGVDTFTIAASDGTIVSKNNDVNVFVSAPTTTQFEIERVFDFKSADGIVFNPVTRTLFAAESYRQDITSGQSSTWILKEIDPQTGEIIRTVAQSEDRVVSDTTIPVIDINPSATRDAIQGIAVVTGTGTSRDGNLILHSPAVQKILEITPNGEVVPTSAGGINFTNPELFIQAVSVTSDVFYQIENGEEFLYVTEFDEGRIYKFSKEGEILSEIKLNSLIPNTQLQGVVHDAVTGHWFLVDDFTGNASSIYEVDLSDVANPKLIGTTRLVDVGRQYATEVLGLTGSALEAYVRKFSDTEGLSFDPETRTLYIVMDDDGRGTQFNFSEIGNRIVALKVTNEGNPAFAEESYEFTITDDAEEGDDVGEPVTATDPDDEDTITYAITDGNDDLDEDTKAAFVIDTSTGQISIDDADDLTLVDVFNLTVTATDSEGLTATTDVEITVDSGTIEQDPTTPGIFVIDSNQLINLLVQATSEINNFTLGIFFTDDASGTIDGSNPGDSDYAAKALERSLSLLSVLGGDKNDKIPPGQLKKVLGLQSAASLVSAQQSTDLFFGFIGSSLSSEGSESISLSTDDGFEITPNEDASFSISLGNNTFTFESTYTLDNVSEYVPDLPLLVGDDDEQVSAVIADFSDVAPGTTVTVTASVSREAAYDNVLGFFAVNADGDVLTLTGDTVAFSDNDTSYRQAIRDNLRKNDLKVNDGDTNKLFEVDITINNVSNGFYILPVLAVQGDFSTAAEIYYPVLSLNDDSLDRMASFGVSQTGALVFGFEDLPSAVSDRDFDDFVVQVTFG